MVKIQEILVDWYTKNKRDLPWRHSKSAYHIWLSEIIMQQTQVIQGTKYFLKFINTYETISDLANASEDEVLAMWQGLGYYSRARNLHYTAQFIRDEHNGIFPSEYKDILKLKGVGQYTAAAISTFAFNKPYPLVDGNVFRLYSRLFDISTEINTSQGQKEFTNLAENLLNEIDEPHAIIYNQAIMEYGALVCKPKNPNCETCTLQANCIAFTKNNHLNLPKKKKNKPKTDRTFHYFYLYSEEGFWVQKRTKKDIWIGLYEFPLSETKEDNKEYLKEHPYLNYNEVEFNVFTTKHILSHQNLTVHFHKQYISEKVNIDKYEFISYKTIESIGFPQVIYKFLQQELKP